MIDEHKVIEMFCVTEEFCKIFWGQKKWSSFHRKYLFRLTASGIEDAKAEWPKVRL